MKKLLFMAAITLSICSCNDTVAPKQIAQDFIKAVASNDNVIATSLATTDTKAAITNKMSPTQDGINAEEQFSLGTLTETINADKADVKNDIIAVNLKKEGSDWKVIATTKLISIITNRQASLTMQRQKWEALLREYENRVRVAKEYVQYKKGLGTLSPQVQKLDEVINALTVKTTWNKETIGLYTQKQKQLADLIEKALEPSKSANSDLSMNYIIQLSDIKDRIKKAEGEYEMATK